MKLNNNYYYNSIKQCFITFDLNNKGKNNTIIYIYS